MLPSLVDSGSCLLSWLIFLPLLGAVGLLFVPSKSVGLAKAVAYLTGVVTFVVSLFLLLPVKSIEQRQFALVEKRPWIPEFGINYSLGVDGLSASLIVLSTFLTILVLFSSGSVTNRVRAYLASILILETGMLGTFCALDGLTFYVFWEIMLIPMYFLIGVWGGTRRIYAALKFVIYTAFGSLLMLVAIVTLAYTHLVVFGTWSFALHDWVKLSLSYSEQLWLFSAFALAFAIKVPIFPLHTWLPDAHVEAPTGGSVILAGVLLKMGLYGLIRFCVPVFPEAVVETSWLFALLGVIGIVYGALVAWVQTDMKKLVAYSSVSHLGFCVLGYASINFIGMQGAILQMINHGISTAALFFLVGVVYDRTHSRNIADYGGIAAKMPIYTVVFLIFTLSSIGLPLTNGFIGEFLILRAGFARDPLLGGIAVSGVILGAVYMLSLYRRVFFGLLPGVTASAGHGHGSDDHSHGSNDHSSGNHSGADHGHKNDTSHGAGHGGGHGVGGILTALVDLTPREQLVFAPLLVAVFILGLFPQPLLEFIAPASHTAIEQLEEVVAIVRNMQTGAQGIGAPGKSLPCSGADSCTGAGLSNLEKEPTYGYRPVVLIEQERTK